VYPVFSRRFLPSLIFFKRYNFQAWQLFSKEALDTQIHQSFVMGGYVELFWRYFLLKGPHSTWYAHPVPKVYTPLNFRQKIGTY
jgi:hypothetical protein